MTKRLTALLIIILCPQSIERSLLKETALIELLKAVMKFNLIVGTWPVIRLFLAQIALILLVFALLLEILLRHQQNIVSLMVMINMAI